MERYDIESDKWSGVAQMNVQRGGVGVAAVGKPTVFPSDFFVVLDNVEVILVVS